MLLERLFYPDDFPIRVTVAALTEDPLHYHPDIEFIYVLRGEIQLKNGYCRYQLRAGDVFTNSGNEVHSMKAVTADNIVAQIQVSTRELSQYFPNLSKACYRTYSKRPNDKKHTRLRELLLQLLMKYELKEYHYKSECLYLMVDIIKHLDKYFNLFAFDKDMVVGFDRGNQLAIDRISRICQYIYQNYANNITLQDLSEMEFLSPFYLSHLIKDFTGMNFREFLCFARVEMSEAKLLGSDHPVSQIAREAGFSTTAYYKKYFTKWFGCDPQEYRTMCLPEIKSDLRPAVFHALPAGQAAALIRSAYAAYRTRDDVSSVVAGVNLDVDVAADAKPLRHFAKPLCVILAPEDYRVLGPGLFEALEGLAPAQVILPEGDGEDLARLRELLAEGGFSIETRPAAREGRVSCACDSIAYPIYLFGRAVGEDQPLPEVFLRDTDGPDGTLLQGQPALLTATGLKKPSYFLCAALSRLRGDIIAQGNQYCVIRGGQSERPCFTVLACNRNEAVERTCLNGADAEAVKEAVNGFRDELDLGVSLELAPGSYSVVKYSLTRENNIFAYLSALDFRQDVLAPYARIGALSGWPAPETYIEDVRAALNVSFSLKGSGLQMAVIAPCPGRP